MSESIELLLRGSLCNSLVFVANSSPLNSTCRDLPKTRSMFRNNLTGTGSRVRKRQLFETCLYASRRKVRSDLCTCKVPL